MYLPNTESRKKLKRKSECMCSSPSLRLFVNNCSCGFIWVRKYGLPKSPWLSKQTDLVQFWMIWGTPMYSPF